MGGGEFLLVSEEELNNCGPFSLFVSRISSIIYNGYSVELLGIMKLVGALQQST
jgi:hypothetical protein